MNIATVTTSASNAGTSRRDFLARTAVATGALVVGFREVPAHAALTPNSSSASRWR